MTTTPTTSAARLSPDREQAIYAATLDLVAEVGYDNLRLDAVAARARTSKATLYRRWTGKADLVASAVGCSPLTDLPQIRDLGSLRADLIDMLEQICALMSGRAGCLVTALLHAMQTDPELARETHANVVEDKRQLWQTIVDQAVARGELPEGTDASPLEEVAPAVAFMRMFVHGLPMDDAFHAHLADDSLIPLVKKPTS
jgi:AcrR family transcriptional regulator